MKDKIIVNTRWEYYAANVTGILAMIGLFIWMLKLAITDWGIDFASLFFWIALGTLIMFPYAIISFFSSMKTIEITATDLTITYVFQKHRNVVRFLDISRMKSQLTKRSRLSQEKARDTFTLILVDGRVFEFSRSQFDQYGKLKAICWKHVRGEKD